MTTLQFANTHNLVAFLSKPAESEGFEQIVDFLNANPIRYALTINPTIYTSCIEQFWATVKAKTINGEVQLQALMDGKKIINTDSIVRRDLQIEDAEVLDLENTKTAQAQEITSLKLRVKKLEKKRGSRTHKLKRLYKVGRSARMVSSDDASLGDQEDASKQGRKIDDINKDAEITLIDETQGRYGDDLMFDTCVLDDEEMFAGQDMDKKEINVAEKEVSTADPVTTTGEVVTTASPTETMTANDLTHAQTLIEIRSAKSKVKGVVIGEQSESTTRTRPQQLPSKDKGERNIGRA
ncbi:hypothetical protein Tco_0313299 [Tanacetum coccineum]